MKTVNTTPAAETPSGPIETRSRADLKPHPRHSAIFHGLSGQRSRARVDDLIEDIRQHGLVRPVEVTVRDVVIDGRLRMEALRRLGRGEVAVQVRRDPGRDRAAIDRRHLQVNADPSRFDLLERVCLAVRAFEIDGGLGYGELPPAGRRELHARLAEVLGTSGRIVADYVAIAAAPRRVQEPFVMGRSSRAWAVSQARSLIASGVVIPATVPRGVTPPEVVQGPPLHPIPLRISRSRELRDLIAALVEGMSTLADRGARLGCGVPDLEHNIRILRQFSDFSRELTTRLERMHPAIERSRQPEREP
jgi:hypothetical protein